VSSNQGASDPPKIFISYRWTSPEHEDWVLLFATSLRQHGVNVILDKWHLSEGQDTLAFMEQMVTDPNIQKVLMICDRGYVERANSREGGVGTEAQIISAKVYERTDQNKYAAIVVDLDDDGRPILPHYMATRLYFDMSSPDAETTNFEKVVRWIFGKPFHAAPPIGEPPAFLRSTHSSARPLLLSSQRLRQAQGGSSGAGAAADVLSEIAGGSRDLILKLSGLPNPEEAVFDAIRNSFPLVEDAYRAFRELVRQNDSNSTDAIHGFFEALLANWDYAPLNVSYSRWDNDVLHYFGHECLVGFLAVAMQERTFSIAADVLSMPLYKPRFHERTGEAATYVSFFAHLESLEARNRKLQLNRISLHADLLAEHHEHSIVKFDSFLEADLTLYVRSLLSSGFGWYPVSGVYLGRSFGSLPTYVRATSTKFYDRLKPLLFNMEADTLRANLTATLAQVRGLRFDYQEVSVPKLLNLEALATTA
jgi:hypothetical protein